MSFAAPAPKTPTIPERYVVRYTHIRCTGCGHIAQSSEFFSVSYLRPRNQLGAPTRHYEACAAPIYNLPIDYTAASPRTTPFCHRCPTIDLSHLPSPPSATQLHDLAEPTLRPGLRPTTQRPKPATPARPKLEDLA